MARHGVLSEFDNAKEEWQLYVERMEQYFSANDVTAAGKKRAILLSACGPATYQLIRNLVSLAATTDKSFAQYCGVSPKPLPPQAISHRLPLHLQLPLSEGRRVVINIQHTSQS